MCTDRQSHFVTIGNYYCAILFWWEMETHNSQQWNFRQKPIQICLNNLIFGDQNGRIPRSSINSKRKSLFIIIIISPHFVAWPQLKSMWIIAYSQSFYIRRYPVIYETINLQPDFIMCMWTNENRNGNRIWPVVVNMLFVMVEITLISFNFPRSHETKID